MAEARELRDQELYTDGERGSSATRRFMGSWDDRFTFTNVPRIGDLHPDNDQGGLLQVRHRRITRVPAQTDQALIEVEYGTPLGDQNYQPASDIFPPDADPIIDEQIVGRGEWITVSGLQMSDFEELNHGDAQMFVPHLEYMVRKLHEDDPTSHLRRFTGTINENTVRDLSGGEIKITGDAGQLLFETFETHPEYRIMDGDVIHTRWFVTTYNFKIREIPWHYTWRNPTPKASPTDGRQLFYGDSVPYTATALHKKGTYVYEPLKQVGKNYYLDFSKTGWQPYMNKTIDPRTGKPFNCPLYPWANFDNLFPVG